MLHKPIREFDSLLKKLEDITKEATKDNVAMMKVQAVLRCINTD